MGVLAGLAVGRVDRKDCGMHAAGNGRKEAVVGVGVFGTCVGGGTPSTKFWSCLLVFSVYSIKPALLVNGAQSNGNLQ